MSSKKLFCYVDETGQDNLGDMFIVSVVVPENRDDLLKYLTDLEVKTGRGRLKWGRVKIENRLKYLKEIFDQRRYPLKAYYSVYEETKEYKAATILTIAKAVNSIKNSKDKVFTILVDGLGERDQKFYGSQLRHLGVHTRKVRGIKKDENDALIRLADSICGFVRDIKEQKEEKSLRIYKKAVKDKMLIEV